MVERLAILQGVIDTNEQPVFALDRDLRYTAFNRAHAEGMKALYGAEIELGRRLTDYQTVAADRESALANLGKALDGERLVDSGYSGEEGRRRFYELIHTPLRGGDGAVTGVIVRAYDVTEQRKIEIDLQSSEARLRRSLAAARAGTWEWDGASGEDTWSDEIWDLYGLERDDRRPSFALWLESVHPDDKGMVADHIAESAAAGSEIDIEWRVNTRDGSLRWLHGRGRRQADAEGGPGGYAGVVVDITSRREAERAMSQSRTELRALVDTVPDIVFQIDREFRLVVANERFTQATISAQGKPITPGESVLAPDYPEEFIQLWRGYYDRALAGEPFMVETSLPHADGTHYLENHLRPIRDDGIVAGVVITSRDITERKRVEQSLRDGEARFRGYFEQTLVGVAVTSTDKGWIDVNQATCDLLGYDHEELSAMTWAELTHSDDLAADVAQFDRVVAGEIDGYSLEKRFIRKDGSIVDVDISVRCTRREDGAVDHFMALLSDVTERRRAANELKTMHDRLDMAQRASGAGIWDWDIVKGTIEWSPEMFGLFGLDAATVEAGFDAWNGVLHPDDLEISNARIATALAEHSMVDSEYRIVKPDGEIRWINALGTGVYDERGDAVRMSGICIDVTQRKRVEEELRETRDYLENLFGYANAPVIVWDPELRIVRFNHAFEQLTQRSAADVVGRHLELLFPDDKRRAAALAHVTSASAGERWEVVEIPILRADGEVRTVLWNSATIVASDGVTPIATIAQGQDITERNRAEEEIRRLNADLERRVDERTRELKITNAELEEFVHSIAHDLRSPLRALSGFSELVRTDYREQIDDTGRDYLRRIEAAAKHLATLMDALLSLSKVGRSKLEIGAVDMSAIARAVAADLRDHDPERAVEFEIEDGLVARGDPALCEIVVQNLLGNAWKFSAAAAAARIGFGAGSADGERVYCVRDNGVGFDPAFVNKLFTPFERLHTAEEFPGTGIGLATVRRAVTRLGGRCWAESELGEGARMYFTLGEPD